MAVIELWPTSPPARDETLGRLIGTMSAMNLTALGNTLEILQSADRADKSLSNLALIRQKIISAEAEIRNLLP